MKNEIKTLKIQDKEYPEQLRKIEDPPKQLYVKGNIQNLKEIGIAVIGSRHCSNYGKKVCKIFVNNLVGYNFNIISGLAIGIDTCAHKSCLQSKGKTIAVLPCGIENIFPKENEELVNKILKNNGTIVTEYEPEFKKTIESCKQRNRIMSGLSIGVLVIEAESRSGTSITVSNATKQCKKSFCIPASLFNSKGEGTNKMIKMGRAKMVTSIEDIINEYPELKLNTKPNFDFTKLAIKKTWSQKNQIKKLKNKSQEIIKIDEENLEIYKALNERPKDINEIALELNRTVSEVTYKLMMLKLDGIVEELSNKKYRKIKK